MQDFVSAGSLHAFPTLRTISRAPEEELTACGLGYRAGYLRRSAQSLGAQGRPREALEALRSLPRAEAEKKLQRLPGVGPKVAACVALYGLGFHDAVPVDVHVARVAESFAPPEMARRLRGMGKLWGGD